MNSTAFLLLANSNPEVDEIQIPFGTVDFRPHQSSFTQVFKSMDQDMDLTFGSLNFCVGSLGSIRLSDPAKLGPSASHQRSLTTINCLSNMLSMILKQHNSTTASGIRPQTVDSL
jgi:hypothetical protein